ncbi:Facilitated trehalose transporter Tret1 [Chamberlinius hualienensis]
MDTSTVSLLSHSVNMENNNHYYSSIPISQLATKSRTLWQAKRELFIVILAGLAYTPLATVVAYSSPALPDLEKEYPGYLTPETGSWFSSLGSLGAAVGTLLGGPMANRFGRKTSLLYTLLCLIISWLIILGSNNYLWILLLGRLLTGITSGALLSIIPTYVAEISSAEFRGTMQSIVGLVYQFGYVFTYAIGALCDWKWLTIACVIHVAVVTIGIPYLPESPRWLISCKRISEAESTLKWIRNSETYLGELNEIRNTQNNPQKLQKLNIRSPNVYIPLLLSLGLMFILTNTGIDVVLFYTVTIFQQAHSNNTNISSAQSSFTFDPYVETLIVASCGLIGVIISSFIIDRCGRRPVLILSGALVAFFMASFGVFFKISENEIFPLDGYGWIPMVCLLGFLVSYNIGWGGVPYALSAEMLPTEARALGSGLCFTVVWIFGFVWTKCFVIIKDWIGISGMFWIFSSAGVLGVFFTFFLIPETKGKSLEQIEQIFRIS